MGRRPGLNKSPTKNKLNLINPRADFLHETLRKIHRLLLTKNVLKNKN